MLKILGWHKIHAKKQSCDVVSYQWRLDSTKISCHLEMVVIVWFVPNKSVYTDHKHALGANMGEYQIEVEFLYQAVCFFIYIYIFQRGIWLVFCKSNTNTMVLTNYHIFSNKRLFD